MKKVRIRTLMLLMIMWSSALIMNYPIKLLRMMSESTPESIKTIDLTPYLICMALYLVVAIVFVVWLLKAKKEYKGKNFLKSQIVILDEDERGLNIHYKASEAAMNFVQVISIIVLTVYILKGNYSIQIENLFIAGAILYTCYSASYYYNLKKMYFA